jgi:tetratricopeptide (TPR) repeat protein
MPDLDFESVFRRAAARAQETADRNRSEVAQARAALDADGRLLGVLDHSPQLQASILREAIARAWEGRFGRASTHLQEFIELRRLAARAYARSRHPGLREAWFDAAARTANAYRIAGRHEEAGRVLWRLEAIERFTGPRGLTSDTMRAIQERGVRRLGFLATLERARGNYSEALRIANWTVAKVRLVPNPPNLAAAYSRRAAIRVDYALELVGDERLQMLDEAHKDIRKCLDNTADATVAAGPIASLALWRARSGEPFEQLCSYLESYMGERPLPEAIALRLAWARALAVAPESLADADTGLAQCCQRFHELERPTDAGIVVLDRIRIRYEAGVPLGIVQLVLEAKARLRAAELTPETNRVLDALWARALLEARRGPLRAMALAPHLEAAHRALSRP